MSERTYSQVNTGISVREASFLSPAQFDALLNSSDAEARANLLQGTAYALEADQLRQVQVVEQALMKHLLAEYDWAYQVAPNPAVVDLFALKYTYHNLKVFLKERATEMCIRDRLTTWVRGLPISVMLSILKWSSLVVGSWDRKRY